MNSQEIYLKKYNLSNKDKIKVQKQNYYIKNKQTINKRNKIWANNNQDKIKKLREKNRDINILYQKKYRKINKTNYNLYIKNKRKINVHFKIAQNLRRRINKAIVNGIKSDHTLKLLGTDIENLKQHLENQFLPGMTWDNYGLYGWHIDHIIPCIKFDLSKPEEQIKCFHYSNLQPLWAKDNIIKGGK